MLSDIHKREIGCLYGRQPDTKLNNVKFFRGDARLIRAEEFREEQRKIDALKRDGKIEPNSVGPRAKKRGINFREFVSSL